AGDRVCRVRGGDGAEAGRERVVGRDGERAAGGVAVLERQERVAVVRECVAVGHDGVGLLEAREAESLDGLDSHGCLLTRWCRRPRRTCPWTACRPLRAACATRRSPCWSRRPARC